MLPTCFFDVQISQLGNLESLTVIQQPSVFDWDIVQINITVVHTELWGQPGDQHAWRCDALMKAM